MKLKNCDSCGGMQRVCEACDKTLRGPIRMIPAPYGSRNAADEVEICEDCETVIVRLVGRFLRGELPLETVVLVDHRVAESVAAVAG